MALMYAKEAWKLYGIDGIDTINAILAVAGNLGHQRCSRRTENQTLAYPADRHRGSHCLPGWLHYIQSARDLVVEGCSQMFSRRLTFRLPIFDVKIYESKLR